MNPMYGVFGDVAGQIVPQLSFVLMMQLRTGWEVPAMCVCKRVGQIMRQFSKGVILAERPVAALL